MPIPLNVNGVTYQYPKLGDENWGQDATNWAVGITQLVNSIDTLINNTISAGLFELADGSAGTPSLRFQNSLTTGIYRAGSNILAFSSSGAQSGQISATGRLQWTDGSLASPAISFISDSDTGIYRPGSNQLSLVTGGVSALSIDGSQNVSIAGSLTVNGSISLTDVTVTGNTTVGNANTDTLNIIAELISNISPDATNTYDLGLTAQRWRDAYISRDAYIERALLGAGTASLPSITFETDLDTGFYRSAANQIGISSAGSFRGEFRSDGFYYNLPFYAEPGTPSSASFTFLSDTNTGLYRSAADEWSMTAGGTQNLVGGINSIQSRLPHGLVDGTAGSPALFFNADTNTGLYRVGADELGFSTNGTIAGSVDGTRKWTLGLLGDSVIHRVNGSLEQASSASLGFTQDPLKESTLLDNTTGNVFTMALANSNIIVDYSIVRGTGKETGQLIMSSDGTSVQVSGNSSAVVDCGVSFSGDINAGNIRLRYTTTSTGSNATMRYSTKRWGD